VPVAVEVAGGLTDAYIARLPTKHRLKPGHGKPRDPEYLEGRGVHFHMEPNYLTEDKWRTVILNVPLPCQLVTWDRELMRELLKRDPNIKVVDFEKFLDTYIADLPNKQKPEVEKDLAKFRRYYFNHNEDPHRLDKIETFLR
jgi:hypothetical protein